MKISKRKLQRYENFCEQYPEEVASHGHPAAALFCCFGTMTDEINELKEWLVENRPDILKLMEKP